jgi:hypothetical protein
MDCRQFYDGIDRLIDPYSDFEYLLFPSPPERRGTKMEVKSRLLLNAYIYLNAIFLKWLFREKSPSPEPR